MFEVLSEADKKQSQVILRLLRQATSQPIVKDFLREKGAQHTAGNWDDLIAKRIQPALEQGRISVADLRKLLEEVEEHGKQHTFLFRCSPDSARQILSEKRITDLAHQLGLADALSTPQYVEMPEELKIVDIRLDRAESDRSVVGMTIKMVERRETSVLLDDSYDETTSKRTKVYTVTRKRAVSIAHLDSTGLLELRIASQDNSTKYHEQISEIKSKIHKLIPQDSFVQLSLSPAKDALINKSEELAGQIRYSNASAKNDYGFMMNLSGSQLAKNLSDDDGSNAAIKGFLGKKGYVTGSNIWVILPDSESREIHVILNGEVNEFTVTAACTPREYSYVRGKILSLN